jgi:hypothetical protein
MPKALYRLSRLSSRRNPHPVVVHDGIAVISAEQVSQRLLCRDCEDRFSASGEDPVLRHCNRGGGRFRLRDALRSTEAEEARSGFSVHRLEGSLAPLVAPHIYFALSIIWRAAAATWRFGGKPLERLSLGPYEERIRRCLLGEEPVPTHARIVMQVLGSDSLGATSAFPYSSRVGDVFRHKFSIPGEFFILFLGQGAPLGFDTVALNSSVGPRLFLGDGDSGSALQSLERALSESRSIGSLSRERQGTV